jgi:hypothetical protein
MLLSVFSCVADCDHLYQKPLLRICSAATCRKLPAIMSQQHRDYKFTGA